MLHAFAAIAAGAVFLVAQFIYLRQLRQWINAPVDPLRPRIVSWIVWLGLDGATWWGMWLDPKTSRYDLGQLTGALVGGCILFIMVWRHMEVVPPKRWEYVCLVLGLASIYAVVTVEEKAWSVACAQLGGFIGTIPTIKSVMENPRNEPALPWAMYLATAPLQVIAIEHWSWSTSIQLGCFVLVQSIIVYYTSLKPRRLKQNG